MCQSRKYKYRGGFTKGLGQKYLAISEPKKFGNGKKADRLHSSQSDTFGMRHFLQILWKRMALGGL